MSKYVKPEGTVQFFLDEKFAGEPPLTSNDEMQQFCPKCFKNITNEDSGYGMAFGGIGTYWTCGNEDCDWFYKIMDQPEV